MDHLSTLTVLWTCQCDIYSGTSIVPIECPAEFETEEDRVDWEDSVCSTVCPQCGSHLRQRDGHACTIV